jgi:UDP-2,3-diacylglucosamine hydrolase
MPGEPGEDAARTVVFSDVHLSVKPEDAGHLERFTAFLRSLAAPETRRIVVLGDLFDFWFEYRQVVFSGYFEVLRALAELRDSGAELVYVCGNHDFWAGRFLRDHLGFTIYGDPVTLDFGPRRVHLAHGDGINPADRSYRAYKRFARHPWVVGAFRLIHPDWAMAIAQTVSHGSRKWNGDRDPSKGSEVQPLRDYAQDVLARGEADAVLCGHSHYPEQHAFPTPTGQGTYLNTGDWLRSRTYAVYEEGTWRIEKWGEE